MTHPVPSDIDIHWFLPTHGEGRYLGTSKGGRVVDIHYLKQVAEAADRLGYRGVLIPTGKNCEDSWVIASALATHTQRLHFIVAVRPGLLPPSLAARMTATLDRVSGGRLIVNVVTGGDPVENKGDGIHLSHRDRYRITDEFIDIYTAILRGETVDHLSDLYHIEGARLLLPPLQIPHPPLFFGGSSEAGIAVAAEKVDTYLTWGEPPEAVAEKIGRVRAAAAKAGRRVNFGIRLHVIVRETSAEAWAAADDLIRHVDDRTVAEAQASLATLDSIGQARMVALHGGRRDRLEVSPNLWAGVGLVRGGAGTALVGSPEEVRDRIEEYRALGIDQFILSGYPHLEEAYRFAELVMPLLPLRRHEAPLLRDMADGPIGEFVGETLLAPRTATVTPLPGRGR